MNKIKLFLLAFLLYTSAQAQGANPKKINRIIKKATIYLAQEVKEINTITVINDGRSLEKQMTPVMKIILLQNGIKTLSERAVKQRLLEIEKTDSGVAVNGGASLIKSDLVWKLNVIEGFAAFTINVEIIDLSKDGEIVGTVNFRTGLFNPPVVAEALVIAILRKL